MMIRLRDFVCDAKQVLQGRRRIVAHISDLVIQKRLRDERAQGDPRDRGHRLPPAAGHGDRRPVCFVATSGPTFELAMKAASTAPLMRWSRFDLEEAMLVWTVTS